jgi:hypothetical protein
MLPPRKHVDLALGRHLQLYWLCNDVHNGRPSHPPYQPKTAHPPTRPQVVSAVTSGSRLAVPDADTLPGGGFDGLGAYVSLMRRCWEADPGLRPGFEEVVQELRRVWSAHAKGSGDRS